MKITEGGQFENPTPGNVIGRCVWLIDMGTQPRTNPKTGETWKQREVSIHWELSEKMQGIYKEEMKGRPFMVRKTFKQSMNAAANLRKTLELWRGKKFTSEEIKETFNLKAVLGQPCMLGLVENGDYINVDAVGKLPTGLKAEPQINPSIYFSLDEDEFDPQVFASLPEKMREKISKSPEFIKVANPKAAAPQGDDAGPAPFPTDEDGGNW